MHKIRNVLEKDTLCDKTLMFSHVFPFSPHWQIMCLKLSVKAGPATAKSQKKVANEFLPCIEGQNKKKHYAFDLHSILSVSHPFTLACRRNSPA